MKSFVAVVLLFVIASVSANAGGCGLTWDHGQDCGCGEGIGGTIVDDCNPQPGTTLTRVFGRPIHIKPEDTELVLAPSPVIVKPTLVHQSSPVLIRPTVISRPQSARVSVAQPVFRVQSEVQRLPALAPTCGTQGIVSGYGPSGYATGSGPAGYGPAGYGHGSGHGISVCDAGVSHGDKPY